MKTSKTLIGILTITMALLAQAQAQSFLTNGLVAFYRLNGNAFDASGNANNGTLSDITFVADRFGTTNGAAAFAGNSSSKITINFTNVNVAPDFTASMWVNPSANFSNGRLWSTTGYEIGAQNGIPYVQEWGLRQSFLPMPSPPVPGRRSSPFAMEASCLSM